ncbi:hypothetical protein [Streptomyces sp. NRRL F-2580]|uniref:hypothetical protein n=1 Tax=Streptomyces sp. NRRL F-2580 TaxID=1463841 RepID=UPI0004C81363|nr:hypothetical protein [Streptomyces sp. NRRL F-2580]
MHPAFTGRVKRLVALGRTSPARTDDPDGHGTHVAGSVLGDGTSASMGGAITGHGSRGETGPAVPFRYGDLGNRPIRFPAPPINGADELKVSTSPAGHTLKITLVWTDPAGEAEAVVIAHRITRFAQPYAVAWRIL